MCNHFPHQLLEKDSFDPFVVVRAAVAEAADDGRDEVPPLEPPSDFQLNPPGKPPPTFPPLASLNESRYSLTLENRSARSSFLESITSFRAFSLFERLSFDLTVLAVAVTAAFPPLKAATLPAVIAAASSTTILFRVGKEDWKRQKIENNSVLDYHTQLKTGVLQEAKKIEDFV